jgi:hypothetical protein
MKPVLIYARPFSLAALARIDVRMGDGGAGADHAVGGFAWEPVITGRPELSIELFTLALDGQVQAGKCKFSCKPKQLMNVGTNPELLYWDGAPITVFCDGPLEGPTAIPAFTGTVQSPSYDKDGEELTINAEVSSAIIDVNLLTLIFNGDGASGGDAAKRGTLRPAGFGTMYSIEPVWFDSARNIGQIDGYANTLGIDWLGEGLSSFGASVGDYASYAALAAAIDAHAVPPGRWATCIAEGLVGLGAPPVGVITCHARFGYTKSGAWMQRILQTHAGIASGLIDTAAFSALDTAVNRPIGYWTAEQRNVKDLLQAIARAANATPLINFQGQVTVTRVATSAAAFTLDRAGGGSPRVKTWRPGIAPSPYYNLVARTARPGRVLTFDEVNYVDDIIDRGLFNSATVYRAGNRVSTIDGTGYLYINATAASGHVPPAGTLPPATPASDAYWQQVLPPSYTDRGDYAGGTTYYQGQIVSTSSGARYLYINATASAGNAPPNATYWQQYTGATDATLVGGRTASAILATIDAAASDNILSTGEKGQIIIDYNALVAQRDKAKLRYGVLGAPVELTPYVTDADIYLGFLTTYLSGLSPSWSDVTQNTPITGTSLRSFWLNASTAVESLSAAVAAFNTSQTEFFDPMNYATVADFQNAWIAAGTTARMSVVTSPDTGGSSIQLGTNTDAADLMQLFGTKWLPYSPEDLYYLEFDLDIQAASGTAVLYLGVNAVDRAGNNLGGSHCYVAAEALNESSITGRRTYRAWMRGYTTGVYATGSTQENPSPLPDGTANGFGQGGTVKIRPLALIHYPGAAGRAVLHSVTLRKAKDTTVVPTGPWSSTRTYFPDEGVRSAEGRLFYALVKNLNHQPPTTATSDAYWIFYLDRGDNGDYTETRFIRSNSPPATPTGDDPAGWTIGIPPGSGAIWQSQGPKQADGTLISVWTAPQQISGVVRRGDYVSTSTYYLENIVQYNGGSYSAVQDNFSGHAPSGTASANAYWDVFAAPGATGAPAVPPSAFTATIPLSSGAAVNLYDVAIANGYSGHSDATITFTVPSGVTIRGLALGGIGIDTGVWDTTSYAIALTLVIQSGGVVDGGGGNGGSAASGNGGAGGDGIYLRTPMSGGITINSGGVLRGGGGGGGASRNGNSSTVSGKLDWYGGAGGGGAPNGGGGSSPAGTGGAGTTSGGGLGGAADSSAGAFGAGMVVVYAGGAGGGYATAGSAPTVGGAGGAAGYAVRKNSKAAAVTNNGTMTGTAA